MLCVVNVKCKQIVALNRGQSDTPLTRPILSSNPVHGEVYSIQHYVTCDRSVFFSGYLVSSTNKTDHHDITEILLKVSLNTINQTKPIYTCFSSLRRNGRSGSGRKNQTKTICLPSFEGET
jgi:hypothetical protein